MRSRTRDRCVVRYMLPHPGQSWVELSTRSSLEEAGDEVQWEAPRQAPGTLWRIDRSDRPVRLLVTSASGLAAAAPSPPRWRFSWLGTRPRRAKSGAAGRVDPVEWIEAWDGPDAWGDWMFGRCKGVDQAAITRAACAVADASLPHIPESRRPIFCEALEAARSRADRLISLEDAVTALRASVMATVQDESYETRTASRSAELAVINAAGCVVNSEPHKQAPSAATYAAAAEMVARRDESDGLYAELLKRQASLVRKFIPLGIVLVVRADDPTAPRSPS